MKRTQIKRKSSKKQDKRLSILEDKSWYKSIPEGSHGSTTVEKRLWKLVSDYVRTRDFERWGNCISCGKMFNNWNEAQAGHYRPFAKCKGYTKFDYRNCFAQCAYCNSRMNEDKFEGGRIFAHNIKNRFGKKTLDLINKFTDEEYMTKRDVPVLLEMMEEIIFLMADNEIKPDYWNKLSTHEMLTLFNKNDNI